MVTTGKRSKFYYGWLYLYLSNYELWPLWQGRTWKEVSISSEGVLILKLHWLKSKINLFFSEKKKPVSTYVWNVQKASNRHSITKSAIFGHNTQNVAFYFLVVVWFSALYFWEEVRRRLLSRITLNFNTSLTCYGAWEEAQSMSVINPLDVKASLPIRQQWATSKY